MRRLTKVRMVFNDILVTCQDIIFWYISIRPHESIARLLQQMILFAYRAQFIQKSQYKFSNMAHACTYLEGGLALGSVGHVKRDIGTADVLM